MYVMYCNVNGMEWNGMACNACMTLYVHIIIFTI